MLSLRRAKSADPQTISKADADAGRGAFQNVIKGSEYPSSKASSGSPLSRAVAFKVH